MVLVASQAQAALVAQIGRCVSEAEKQVENAAKGLGNEPSLRKLRVFYAYARSDTTKTIAQEIASTNRIELCYAKPASGGSTTAVTCPGWSTGGNQWVFYDRNAGIATEPKVSEVKSSPTSVVTTDLDKTLLLDWDHPDNKNLVLFFMVNATSQPTSLSAVSAGITASGFCGVPFRQGMAGPSTAPTTSNPGDRTASSISHVLYAVPRNFSVASDWTFGSVCSNGDKANYGRGWGDVCVDPDGARFALGILTGVDQWQLNTVQAGLPSTSKIPTWWNGRDLGTAATTCAIGSKCPTRVFWEPVAHGAGFGYGGVFSTPPGYYWTRFDSFDPTLAAAQSLETVLGSRGGILRAHAHEYFHGVQENRRNNGGLSLFFHEWFAESSPTATEWAACMTNFPGVPSLAPATQPSYSFPSGQCVSARNLYETYGSLTVSDPLFLNPENQALHPLASYAGGLLYRYMGEQFSYPAGSLSNLSSHTSAFPVGTDSSGALLPLSQRRPDEGMDLMGYFLTALDSGNTINLPCNNRLVTTDSAETRIACVVSEYLGRSFEDLLLEWHTMMVLKDYVTTDSRWRMSWLGDYNAGNNVANLGQKPLASDVDPSGNVLGIVQRVPFVKSTATGGSGFPATPNTQLPDLLYRVHRIQDTYTCINPSQPCTGTNLRVNQLAVGASLEGGPVGLTGWGSAYVSIHPAAGYGPLNVHAKVTHGTPRFRVFAIDASGRPTLAASCNSGARGSEVCPIAADGTMDVTIPINATSAPDEILLVVSSGTENSGFSWRLGSDPARLRILSPTASAPANIGGYSGTTLQTRPAVVYFSATQGGDRPFDTVTAASLFFTVDGTAINNAGDCPGTSCPFTLTPMSGGTYMAIVNVPTARYPATAGTLDLGIQVAGLQSASEADALSVSATAAPVATALVLDASGSMRDNGKSDAVKKAAALILDGMADTDYAGLVMFATHSLQVRPMTLLSTATIRSDFDTAIQSVTAEGSTSIGDGMFRAQDALATAFDNATGTIPVQHIVLLTDGMSNCDWTPSDYLKNNKSEDAPTVPGTGECSPGTVSNTPPWPADGIPAPYANARLAYFNRRDTSPQLRTPIISAIGIGSDADMGFLNYIATMSGGSQLIIPTQAPASPMVLGPAPSVATEADYTLGLADAFRASMNAATGRQRVLSAIESAASSLSPFAVESQSTELLVSVLSLGTGADTLMLRAPGGALIAPIRSTTNRAVFKVAAPPAGTWTWQAGTTTAGQVFVEAAVRSSCQLYVKSDVIGRGSLVLGDTPATADDQRWAGSDISLVATLENHGGVAGAILKAQIMRPDGRLDIVQLDDDGRHGDGAAADGIYGATYTDTSVPGAYQIRYLADPGSASNACRREKLDGIRLRAAQDSDGDGLPDWWQSRYGLASGSAGEDPDRDGLTNLQEFQAHTRPDLSDTDGGGESDGSEVAMGGNPLAPQDDVIATPTLAARPGNNRILAQIGMLIADGVTVEIYTGPAEAGPFTLSYSTSTDPGPIVNLPAVNDVLTCLVARATAAGVSSGWSRTICVTPKADPNPPSIDGLSLADGSNCLRGGVATVKIAASDSAQRSHAFLDPDAPASGITQMLVSVSTSSATPTWQAFQPQITVSLGSADRATVVIQVRDAANNESAPATLQVQRCYAPLPCFFGKNSVRIGDRSTVSPSVGSNQAFELGAGTVRGEVTALTSAFFRDRATLAGALYIPNASQITYQNQNTISIKDIELIPGAKSWTLDTKTVVPGGQSITVEKTTGTCKRTLDPGAYATVTVRPECTLELRPGTYDLKELSFDANSFLSVLGPVRINVLQRFNYGDYVKMSGASSPQDVQIYTNASDVTILPSSVFTGLLRAPSANVTVMSRVAFNGCIAASSLVIEPDSVLTGTRW